MKNEWLKIAMGAGLLWYGVLRGARGLKIGCQSFEFDHIDVANGTADIKLNIYIKNPLLIGVKLKGIQGDVYIQDQKAGTVDMQYDYKISGGKTHIIPIIVKLAISGTAQAALSLIQSGQIQNLTVAFDGKVMAGEHALAVPVKFTLDWEDMTA